MADKLEIIITAKDNASSTFKKITGAVSGLGKLAAGAALGGVVAVGAGLVTAGVSGLSFNNSMEIVTAQLNAFTKDSAKTADILEMIKKRASQTPFAFEEMAKATTSLMSSAKQSGQSLEYLVEQAEILAASNPAEGLEGAAFALKEAVSGDFTSIIERFNLPRQYINQLKDEGVPALEIVSKAMEQMGLDTSLVTNLAATAQGRWSTFLDTLQNLSATITKPIFDAFSNGLGNVNGLLEANAPLLQSFAEKLAGAIQEAITWIIETGIPALRDFANWFTNEGWPAVQQFVDNWTTNWTNIQTKTQEVLNTLKPYWEDLKKVFNDFIITLLPELKKLWLELQTSWQTNIQPALTELMTSLKNLATELGFDTKETNTWKVVLGTLKIILDSVTSFIKTLTPVARTLGEVIKIGAQTTRGFVDSLRSLKSAADSAIGILRNLANKIKDVINAASGMPGWLVPGSPTPFELGIRGIGDAIKNLPTMELPGIGMPNVPALADASSGGSVLNGGSAPVVVNLEYKPVISTADEIELERVLTNVVNRINRK